MVGLKSFILFAGAAIPTWTAFLVGMFAPEVVSKSYTFRIKSDKMTTQISVPWGLNNISHQRSLTDHVYDDTAAEGYAYILESGLVTHPHVGGIALYLTSLYGELLNMREH